MPHIVIHLSGEPDAALARQAVAAVGELTQRVLGKKPEVIATTVHFIPAAMPMGVARPSRRPFVIPYAPTIKSAAMGRSVC